MKLLKLLTKVIFTGELKARYELLRRIGRVLVPNHKFNQLEVEWWNDPVFNEYLIRFKETTRLNAGRRWMLYQLMRLVTNIPGDTAECGVYRGSSSYIICRVNKKISCFTEPTIFLILLKAYRNPWSTTEHIGKRETYFAI